jgi:acetyl esterase/lipase
MPQYFLIAGRLAALACLTCLPTFVSGQDSATSATPKIVHERDAEYGTGGDQKLLLDVDRPEQLPQSAPCVVVIHGGAWRGGNKNAHRDLIEQLARAGYVAATVGYRLCPKYPFPAQVEDVKCAVRYLRAHADQYHLDPKRFGAVGFSAGAHLSLMLGVMGSGDGLEGTGGWPDQSSQVQAVVSFFGPTDLAAPDIPLISRVLVKDFIGGTAAEKPKEYRAASPVTYVSRGDAPVLMFQGTKDPLVPHTQAYRMADALAKAGVPGRVEILLGAGHGWGGDELQRTTEQTLRFLERQLKPQQ